MSVRPGVLAGFLSTVDRGKLAAGCTPYASIYSGSSLARQRDGHGIKGIQCWGRQVNPKFYGSRRRIQQVELCISTAIKSQQGGLEGALGPALLTLRKLLAAS